MAAMVILAVAVSAWASTVRHREDPPRPLAPSWITSPTTEAPDVASPLTRTTRPVPPASGGGAERSRPPVVRTPGPAPTPRTPPTSGPRMSASSEPFDPSSPVSYTDRAGDATGLAPTDVVSQPSFDILRVGWAPASHVDLGRLGYATSITIAGPAREDVVYISYGEFYSDVPGETCQLYHVLVPRSTAFANAYCGDTSSGTRRLVGRVGGSRVTTASGERGVTLVATFNDTDLPAYIEAGGRMLWELSAVTCSAQSGPLSCGPHDTLDHARSRLDYRL